MLESRLMEFSEKLVVLFLLSVFFFFSTLLSEREEEVGEKGSLFYIYVYIMGLDVLWWNE